MFGFIVNWIGKLEDEFSSKWGIIGEIVSSMDIFHVMFTLFVAVETIVNYDWVKKLIFDRIKYYRCDPIKMFSP